MMIIIARNNLRDVCAAVRRVSNATKQELAAALGVSNTTIARWESAGSHFLRVHDHYIEKLARVSRELGGSNRYRLERYMQPGGSIAGKLIRM
jgi:transcriptional regulator with XRE-family HTH domain